MIKQVKKSKENGNYCAIVSLDVTGAFDHAWWPAIVHQIAQKRVPDNLLQLVKGYLSERKAKIIRKDGETVKEVTTGCPQGSKMGPGLWKILHNTIFDTILPTGCRLVLYADDTMLITETERYKELKTKTTTALNSMIEWSKKMKLTFNPMKTQALFYGKKPNQQRPTFKMGDHIVRCGDDITYLGLTISANQRWDTHVDRTCAKVRKFANILKANCRITWGINARAMAAIYEGAIQPAITYGAPIWAHECTKKSSSKLLSVQRVAAVGAAATYRTTSTEAALVLSGLPPVDLVAIEIADRWRTKVAADNPDEVEKIINLRVKIEKTNQTTGIHPAEAPIAQYEIGDEDASTNRIYTDASRTKDGTGAAYVVQARGRELTNQKMRLGKGCSTVQGELAGIREGLKFIREHAHAYEECSIITDSKPALRAINETDKGTPLTREIQKLITEIEETTKIKWHWIKAHSGNIGNDRADKLAKEATNDENASIVYDLIPSSEVKNRLKKKTKQRWQQRWETAQTGRLTATFIPTVEPRPKNRKLDPETTQIVTGHGAFRKYLKKIKKVETETCECGNGDDDTEHLLFECPEYAEERNKAKRELQRNRLEWPTTMDEVKSMANENEWWMALSTFAKGTGKFKPEQRDNA